MEVRHDCFVSGALATILWMSRFTGSAPLRLEKSRNGWQISPSPRLALVGHFFMTVSGVLFVWRLIYVKIEVGQDMDMVSLWAKMQSAVWNVEDIMVAMLAGTTIYGAPRQMHYLILQMNQMQNISCILNIRHWPTQWSKKLVAFFIFWGTASLMVTVADFVIVIIFLSNAQIWVRTLSCLFYIFYWITQMRKMQFVLILLHINSGFTRINDCLRKLLNDIDENHVILGNTNVLKAHYIYKRVNKVSYINPKLNSAKASPGTNSKSYQVEVVRRVVLAYASTCDVMRNVDRSQGLFLLMLLGSLFLHHIVSYYYWIITLIYEHSEDETALLIGYELTFVFWSFVHTLNLVIIIEPCHLTHMEMETTRILVSRLLRRTDSAQDPLAIELDKFYNYLLLNEVFYNPLQITTISRGLLIGILGKMTTYLVLLIQLK